MKNFPDEYLNDQDDNLSYQNPNYSSAPGPGDDDWVEENDEDFDVETGDDMEDDTEDELVNPNVDGDEDLLADDDDDLLADDDDLEDDEDNTNPTANINTNFSDRPHGRTTGRMTDHEPGTPGFASNNRDYNL